MTRWHAFLLGFSLGLVLAVAGPALFGAQGDRSAPSEAASEVGTSEAATSEAASAEVVTTEAATVAASSPGAASFAGSEVKDLFYLRGCVSCHDLRNPLVGPPFEAVAARYGRDPDALEALLGSLRNGSRGTWGVLEMPAQPRERLSDDEARAMLRWILALDEGAELADGAD